MTYNHDKWNLNRLPTVWERAAGILAALVGAIVFAGLSYLALIGIADSGDGFSFVLLAVSAPLLVLCLVIGFRATFGKPRTPSAGQRLAMGYALCLVGILLFALGLWVVYLNEGVIEEPPKLFSAGAIALLSIAFGVRTIAVAKSPNSSIQPPATSRSHAADN